jgi:hypothetical protein
MYEHRGEALLPRRLFLLRLARSALLSAGFIVASLGLGVVGYRVTEGLSWLDAFLNASMILTGMGPVNEMHTTAGKVFAGCYALFSGVAFLTAVAVLFAPVLHRVLHRFHLAFDSESGDAS